MPHDVPCRCSRRRFLGAAVLPLASAMAWPLWSPSSPATAAQGASGFEVLGVPGNYSANPAHWYLSDLQRWHGRIYAAHGNWNDNTGPVRAIYVDPLSGSFVHDDEFQFDDEAIELFVVLNGVLWAIGVDARESWEFGNVYRKPWDGAWEKLRTVPGAVHLFGLGQLGDVLVTSGVDEGAEGLLFQSRNGGRTWEIVTRIENPTLGTDHPIHVYSHIFTLGGRLYVTTPASGCFVFDGTDWASANCVSPTAFGVTKSVRFGDAVAMVPYLPLREPLESSPPSGLVVFDGQQHWSIELGATVWDVAADVDALYILVEDTRHAGIILRVTDLAFQSANALSVVTTLGDEFAAPRSLERSAGRFYVGLADGRLIRSVTP